MSYYDGVDTATSKYYTAYRTTLSKKLNTFHCKRTVFGGKKIRNPTQKHFPERFGKIELPGTC